MNKKGTGEIPGIAIAAFLPIIILLLILGPANLIAFFKAPVVYVVVIAMVIGLFIIRKVG